MHLRNISLHVACFQHIPALGRSDVQSSAIRQHYYPEVGLSTRAVNETSRSFKVPGEGPYQDFLLVIST